MSMSKGIYIAQFHTKHLNCARCTSISQTGSSSVCAKKTPSLTAGSCSSTGSEFQTVGPTTEKVRPPSVLRRYRGTIKRCRLADRRCRLATSVTGVQQLTTYLGALFSTDTGGPWQPACILHAFWNVEPSSVATVLCPSVVCLSLPRRTNYYERHHHRR